MPASRSSLTSRSCKRRMSALDPPLGLAGVGTENLDVEFRQSPAELGHSVAACRVLLRLTRKIECLSE